MLGGKVSSSSNEAVTGALGWLCDRRTRGGGRRSAATAFDAGAGPAGAGGGGGSSAWSTAKTGEGKLGTSDTLFERKPALRNRYCWGTSAKGTFVDSGVTPRTRPSVRTTVAPAGSELKLTVTVAGWLRACAAAAMRAAGSLYAEVLNTTKVESAAAASATHRPWWLRAGKRAWLRGGKRLFGSSSSPMSRISPTATGVGRRLMSERAIGQAARTRADRSSSVPLSGREAAYPAGS